MRNTKENKIRTIWYSLPHDLILLPYTGIALMIPVFILMFINLQITVWYINHVRNALNILYGLFIFRLIWFMAITPFLGINKNLSIFRISRSILNPNKYWISQRMWVKTPDKCLAVKMEEDEQIILASLRKKGVYYCNTHTTVKQRLEKGNVIFLCCKKQKDATLKSAQRYLIFAKNRKKSFCAGCKHKEKDCPLLITKETTFYNIKFKNEINPL